MKRFSLFISVAILILFGAVTYPQVANALSITGSGTLYCDHYSFVGITITTNRDNTGSGHEIGSTNITDGAGTLLYTETDELPLGTVVKGGSGFVAFSPLPKYNPIRVIYESAAGNGLPAQIAHEETFNCPGLPDAGGFQGPGIPAGFVLLTVTCNSPVYPNPGGLPLNTGDAVTAGQTWYANPVAVKDAQGISWTEIYVSGYVNPFIPTSCLGGAPIVGTPPTATPTAAPTLAAATTH